MLGWLSDISLIHELFDQLTETNTPVMDILSCATLSLGEIYCSRSVNSYLPFSSLTSFLAVFVLQYLAIKVYRIFIVPHYLSELRDIPGPDVSYFQHLGQSIADSFRMDTFLLAKLINFSRHCQLSDNSRGCANSQTNT
jgi:hypothetical protein